MDEISEVEINGVTFYFCAQTFQTERRSESVYKQSSHAIDSNFVSVYRYNDPEQGWGVLMISEDRSQLQGALLRFPPTGRLYRPTYSLLHDCALRRAAIVTDPDLPAKNKAHYGKELQAELKDGGVRFHGRPQG